MGLHQHLRELELNGFARFKLNGRDCFTKLSSVTLRKPSACSSKFWNNFIKNALMLKNDVVRYVVQYTQYVGRWVAMPNSVLRIKIAVKCVHISGRG